MKKLKTILLLVLLGAASPLLLQAQTTETYTFITNRVIPDGNSAGLSDVRNLNSAIGTITSLKVRLKVTGEYNGDLYGYVKHSSGFTVLLNRPGKTTSNVYGYADSGLDVTFQTGATNGDIHLYQNATTPADGSPLTGNWQPDGRTLDPASVTDASARSTSLTNFNNLNAAGQWTLYLADVDSGGTNMLTEWSVEITGAAYPALTWSNPADIGYGVALSGAQLNATAAYNSTNVPGTFSYTPAAGAVLNAGLGQTLSVTFTPSNATSFLSSTTNVVVNVLRAPLNITANDTNKIYGAALPSFTAHYIGFTNGDTAASLTTPVTLATTATAASPIGAYTITASGAVDANYTITQVNGTLTVTPAALIITAVDKSKIYGAALPTLTASYSGFTNGDTAASLTTPVTLATTATAASPIGAYTITASGAVDANYTISQVNGTLTVTPAALTITAVDKSKIYGADLPTLTASYSGFTNGDTAASLTTQVTLATTATAASPIGGYPITASGAVDANYTISQVNGTLTVTTATLIVAADDKGRAYGATNPVFTASYTGFVNADNTNALSGSPAMITEATTNSLVGAYAIEISRGTLAGTNYSFSFTNGTLTIAPYALMVTVNNTNRVYGSANPSFTGTVTGQQNGDTISATFASAATTASVIGTYPILATLVDPGSKLGNYSVTTNNGTLTVTPAALIITANDTNKIYGAALPAFTASYSGFTNGDTAASLTTQVTLATAATTASPVGTYTITANGAAGTNYTITQVNGTLAVDPAALTITANDTNKIYGAALPALTARYSGFVNSDTAASLSTPVTLATAATTASPIGTYVITASGAVDANYTISHVNGTLTVMPAALTITAVDKSKIYGAALPALTASYSGFTNGDTAASLTTPVTLATPATAASPAGAYTITANGAVGTNYTITEVNGTLTVTTAALIITANDTNKIYGAALPAFTASYSGFTNGDTAAGLTTPVTFATAATAASDVGTYPITANGANSSNYTVSYVAGTLTVNQSLTTGAIASSANPAVPGANVTFTMSISAVAPGAGAPNGTVNFRIDGAIAGSSALSGGVATFATTTLTHASHTVVAEYAGSLDFVGTTNSLTQPQVINALPIAGDDSIERYPAQGVKVRLSTLLANDSDPDGDTLSITANSTSANAGTIVVSGSWVFYTPAAGFTNADSFTYTITDGHGGSATGTVTVAIKVDNASSQNLTITALDNGSVRISGNGIEGRTYHLQFSDTMSPYNWQDLTGATVTADSTGAFEFTDIPGVGTRFYRSVFP